MAIHGISGSPQQQIPPKVVAENLAPSIAQAVGPQDILGIKTKRSPSKGISPSARLEDLKPEQLSSLGGGASLETIRDSQPSTTVGELGPLLRNSSALDSIAGLMADRRDLKVGDFITRDKKGRVRIDPSYKDGKTMEMLKERPDMTPSQISAMRQNFTKTLKNPALGKQATEKSFELLKKRPDLQPEDMGKLMGSLRKAAGGDQKGKGGGGSGDQAGAMAALDMFDSASNLMGKRTDLKPERVSEMAKSVGEMGSPKDRNGPQNVAEAFDSASKSLEINALRKPEEMSKMASTMNEHFKGGDEKTAGHRMNAFKKSSEMMGENASVDADSVGTMLKQATEREPKIKGSEGAQKAKRLGKVMDDVSSGVKSGTVSAGDLSSHFRNQDAERARFQKTDPKKEQEKQKAEDGKDKPKTGKPGEANQGAEAKPSGKPGDTKETAEPKGEKKVLASFQEEEQNAPPPGPAGAAPKVDAKTVSQLGPGQAAGTASAGVTPGTTSKSGAPDKKPGGSPAAEQAPSQAGGGSQAAAGGPQIQSKGS